MNDVIVYIYNGQFIPYCFETFFPKSFSKSVFFFFVRGKPSVLELKPHRNVVGSNGVLVIV